MAIAESGETIASVGRRGKYVVLQLAAGRRLAVHLRMTGRLIVQSAEYTEPYPYTHVLLTFAAILLPLALAWGLLAWGERDRRRKRRDH